MSSESKFAKLSAKLSANIEVKRYEHIVGVVACARNLAQVYKVNINKAEIAALLHDCGREVKVTDSPSYALHNGLKVNKIERLQPILLHAKMSLKPSYLIFSQLFLTRLTFIKHQTIAQSKFSLYICTVNERQRFR